MLRRRAWRTISFSDHIKLRSMKPNRYLLANLPLFIVLFIDSMGLGLLFPILNNVIVDPASAFLSATTSGATRDFLYSLTVGLFMLSWFFGAAILGDLSDTVGRKKALIICLLGSFVGYFVAAVSIWLHSLPLLILGRVIAGFTAGSQPIAQAAIVDISPPEHKARNIGYILLAISLGFVFGPIFGGVLSDAKLVSWFTFSTPLNFAAIVSFFNAALLWLTFKETSHVTGKIYLKFHRAIQIFISAFQRRTIRYISLVFLVLIFGWSDFFTFISMFVMDRYHFSPLMICLYMGALGLGFAIGCGLLVDFCANRYAHKQTVIVSTALTAAGVLLMLLVYNQVLAWIIATFIGAVMALAYSTTLIIFSNQVGEDEQGWVMGVTGSIMALSFGINSFLTGLVAHYGPSLPIALSVLGLSLSGLLMGFYRPKAGSEKQLS